MVSQVQPMKLTSVSVDSHDFSQMAVDILFSMRLELLMFASAVAGYLLMFSSRVPKDMKRIKLMAKTVDDVPDLPDDEPQTASPRNFSSVDASLRQAAEVGDHRAVIKFWHMLKKFSQVPSVHICQIVESMQCAKKDPQFISQELKGFLQKHSSECHMGLVNDIFEVLGKRLNTELMAKLWDMLPALELKPDQHSYEIFLSMHATTRSFPEIQVMLADMQDSQVELSTRASLAVIKAALQAGNFQEANEHFYRLKASWDSDKQTAATSWPVPRHIMAQFVELACRERRLDEVLVSLQGVPLPEEAINEMLSESIRANDSEIARSVETLARGLFDPVPDSTYALLIKGLAGRPWRMKALVKEVLARETSEFSAELALSVLNFCSKTVNKEAADTLLQRMKPTHLNVLSAFIRFYIECEQPEKACDVFEQYVQPLGEHDSHKRIMIDSRVERSLMSAALHCGRTSLVQCLFDTSRTDVAKHIIMIRRCASEKNLKGAMSLFNSLKDGGVELNSIVYNTVLDACVKCNELQEAEKWMRQTMEAGMADVVSFNTLIKAHLLHENLQKARATMEEMKKAGFQPNRVTYNEVLNAVVANGSRRSDMWEVVKEMKNASIPPNQVTCSILLKNLNSKSAETDILLTMDLIDSIDEPMDEVLLSSIVEACVRIGKPDLLVKKLEALQGANRVIVNGSHTFGSIIKAYGHAKDLAGVWRCWGDMRSRMIKPTSITLGCMVEAVINNGDTDGAFDLVHQIRQDEQCKDALNAVIYCSLLKGFSREKKLDRAWEVYREMSANNVEMSLITFNTILDACARVGRMDQLPGIMKDMKRWHVEPNLITYSTILKGHCQAGDIQLGFAVMKEIKRDTALKPDEIMYNSLLDGCAQYNLFEEGMGLLEEMQNEGISPSNFTLSIMVKLLNRGRRVEEAFDLVRSLPKKYRFKPNAHVYTNLMQACIANRQPTRSLTVLETMVKERVHPDNRTYAILIRSSLYQEKFEQAGALLRAALGLPNAYTIPGLSLVACHPIDHTMVNETLTSLVERGCGQDFAAPLLSDIKKSNLKVNIEQSLQRRITMSMGDDTAPKSSSQFKGKVRSQRCSW